MGKFISFSSIRFSMTSKSLNLWISIFIISILIIQTKCKKGRGSKWHLDKDLDNKVDSERFNRWIDERRNAVVTVDEEDLHNIDAIMHKSRNAVDPEYEYVDDDEDDSNEGSGHRTVFIM